MGTHTTKDNFQPCKTEDTPIYRSTLYNMHMCSLKNETKISIFFGGCGYYQRVVNDRVGTLPTYVIHNYISIFRNW